jgi:hypothetical protein
MATDGIVLSNSRDVKIDQVESRNNIRNGMSLTVTRNVLVTRSTFADTGVVGTAPDSYPLHSPGRGVNIEPEIVPEGADWFPPCIPRTQGFRLTGNILFHRVEVTGNLGGGITMSQGQSTANVTIRNSVLKNPVGGLGDLLQMGIAGGVVEDSELDTQKGQIWITDVAYKESAGVVNSSSVFKHYLEEMAADPFVAAHGIYAETRGVSSTLQGNTIVGDANILRADTAFPFLTIADNSFTGRQTGDLMPPDPRDWHPTYQIFGYMYVSTFGVHLPQGASYTPDARIERNRIFVPNTAPPSASGYGDIIFPGPSHFADNEYTMLGTRNLPFFRVSIDPAGTVVNDRFPTDQSIRPLQFPGVQEYPLSPNGYLNWTPDSAAPPNIGINDTSVTECDTGTHQALFSVTLSRPSTQPITVDFATSDGTATAGSDYDSAAGTVTFQPGQRVVTVAVTIRGDTDPEGFEGFFVNLSSASFGTITDPQAVGGIVNEPGG